MRLHPTPQGKVRRDAYMSDSTTALRFPTLLQKLGSPCMKTAATILLACLGVAAGCASPPEQPPLACAPAQPTPATRTAGLADELPALYSGVLPCADCPGIRYELDLRSPSVYFLRMTYLERASRFDEVGEWSLTPDGKTLVLHGGAETPERFMVKDNTLRKLDIEGKEIVSRLNYNITRQSDYTPLEPSLPHVKP